MLYETPAAISPTSLDASTSSAASTLSAFDLSGVPDSDPHSNPGGGSTSERTRKTSMTPTATATTPGGGARPAVKSQPTLKTSLTTAMGGGRGAMPPSLLTPSVHGDNGEEGEEERDPLSDEGHRQLGPSTHTQKQEQSTYDPAVGDEEQDSDTYDDDEEEEEEHEDGELGEQLSQLEQSAPPTPTRERQPSHLSQISNASAQRSPAPGLEEGGTFGRSTPVTLDDQRARELDALERELQEREEEEAREQQLQQEQQKQLGLVQSQASSASSSLLPPGESRAQLDVPTNGLNNSKGGRAKFGSFLSARSGNSTHMTPTGDQFELIGGQGGQDLRARRQTPQQQSQPQLSSSLQQPSHLRRPEASQHVSFASTVNGSSSARSMTNGGNADYDEDAMTPTAERQTFRFPDEQQQQRRAETVVSPPLPPLPGLGGLQGQQQQQPRNPQIRTPSQQDPHQDPRQGNFGFVPTDVSGGYDQANNQDTYGYQNGGGNYQRTYTGAGASGRLGPDAPNGPAKRNDGGHFYRPSGGMSNIADWAPAERQPFQRGFSTGPGAGTPRGHPLSREGSAGAASFTRAQNLPDWTNLREYEPTSHPIGDVRRDLDFSIRRLLSENVLDQLLRDEVGRFRFRKYLAESEGTEAKLDMIYDLDQYMTAVETLKSASEAIHDTYLNEATAPLDLPAAPRSELFHSLQSTFALDASIAQARSHLAKSLYQNEFQSFVKDLLIEQSKVKLGAAADTIEGLGQAFTLTNPRMRDHPIVLVSPAFEQLTGYSRSEITGRNCRMIQGPSTSLATVGRIRASLNKGQGCCELVLNYTRSGKPFWNLLNIMPLKDSRGDISYYIGGQTNVTSAISSSADLSFLLGGDKQQVSITEDTAIRMASGYALSPSLARSLQRTGKGSLLDAEDAATGRGLSNGHARRGSTDSGGSRKPAAGALINGHAPDLVFPAGTPKEKPVSNVRKGNAFSKFFNRKSAGPQTQLLSAAESGPLRAEAFGLESQLEHFKLVYSKVILFKTYKREIVFASPELLLSLGMQIDSRTQLYDSPLLHVDLLSLLQGDTLAETKNIRKTIQESCRTGQAISVAAKVRHSPGGFFRSSPLSGWRQVHLTPLFDREAREPFAYVAIIS